MSPRVAELLVELALRGISVRPAGALLGVRPRAALTPELVSRIRELKGEILSVLGRQVRELHEAGPFAVGVVSPWDCRGSVAGSA